MSPSLIGNLLVSSSLVEDPLMGKAVCLLVHQEDDRLIGVMLNRPIHPHPAAFLNLLANDHPKSTSINRFDFPDEPNTKSPEGDLAREHGDDLGNTSPPPTAEPELGDDPGDHDNNLVSDQTGLIANSDAERTIAAATKTLGTVHFGGPLSGPVVAVHGSSEFAEAETGSGIYVAAQKPNLEGLVRQQSNPFRLIVGHIGWNTQQLQAEMDAGFWHMVPATSDAVFANDLEMWPQLIRRATARSVARWIGTPDVPMAYQVN
ncbi:MAG: YqgE/AlgH family protein [Pirellulaceae bacterium]|nr:YqgE/AlgH family protein [Pirellulaceae bacterium]